VRYPQKELMIRIYPSLISSDLLSLHTTISMLDHACAGFHIDVMDNHFVPNLTWGHHFINAIDAASCHPSWVHLMVDNPEQILDRCILKANSIVSIHRETERDVRALISKIRERILSPSIAISPKTDLEETYSLLAHVDHVLIMSVEPGFSGQTLLPRALEKIAALRAYKEEKNYSFRIAIDGGITVENIGEAQSAGCDDYAVATAIFDKDSSNCNYLARLKNLYDLLGQR
jgi:ribulose-phosphate 3-epimerase